MTRFRPSLRTRTVALVALFTFTSFFVSVAPTDAPLPIPEAVKPQPAKALACADGPSFEGRLTSSSASTTAITTSTTGNVFGYLSNVVDDWSCTAFYRYDGLAWTRNDGELDGNFDWGNLINSTTVACNWAIGSTDYLKANSTNDCPDSDAEYAMPIFLANTSTAGDLLEAVFHADSAPDAPGDFAYIHSDCESYYGGETVSWNQPFSTGDVGTRPGSNCDPYVIDSTNTTQSIVVDKTAPAIAFDWPPAGGPTLVTSAFAGVQFDATDNVAGFSGTTYDWDLQRQKATWSGSACGTFANDTTSGSLQSGVTNAANQVASQGLADTTCYRWTLAARDDNGNTATTITSGSIRTDVQGNLGKQSQHTFEDWDLGGGDTLSVNVGTGNLVIEHPILDLPFRGGSFGINLTYNRHDPTNIGMGPGWRLDVNRRLTLNADNTVTFTDGDGARHTFTAPVVNGTVTTYTRPATLYATLVKDTSQAAEFVLTYRDKSVDVFDLAGSVAMLLYERDRFGNQMAFTYNAGTTNLYRATDPTGRYVEFTWDTAPAIDRLTQLSDWSYLNGSGVVQTSATGSRALTRFLYDAAGNLSGWADPLAPAAVCPHPSPSTTHLTCVAYPTDGLDITKGLRVSTYSGGVLGTAVYAATTKVTFINADVSVVKDPMEVLNATAGTDIRHVNSAQTQVVRRGDGAASFDTVTRYTLLTASDPYARIGSVKRRATVGPETWLATTTAYDATYPIQPATVTEDDGGALQRVTTLTYVPASLGLLSRSVEPLNATDARWTDLTYNANNDITQKKVSLNGSSSVGQSTYTRYCYGPACGLGDTTSLTLLRTIDNYVDGTKGGSNGHVEDVTTEYQYDAYGQRTRDTRWNYLVGGTLADSRALGFEYDTNGNLTKEIANYVSGTVTSPGSDITPDSATNARTDLTTVHTYDTAGNAVSTADPRRAIETAKGTSLAADDYVTRRTFDALRQGLTETTPTTPGSVVAQKTSSSTYDEYGNVRSELDLGDMVTTTLFDRAGRAIASVVDTDGAGPSTPVQSSATAYDPQGRTILRSDERQVAAPSTFGQTRTEYDQLGRVVKVIEVWRSPALPDQSTTTTVYDARDRIVEVTSGAELGAAAQTTRTTYDAGSRATSIDEELTCTTFVYDYRDLASQSVEGRTSGTPCTGTGTQTINQVFDGLARLTSRTVAGGNVLAASTFDGASRPTKTWSTEAGGITRAVESTYNSLDETTLEWRYTDTSGTKSAQSWARSNRDPAGNETDRCSWTVDPGATWCVRADGAGSISPVPTTASSSTYDALNNRIEQYTPGVGSTTYDPAAAYQVSGVYVPTAGGRERQTVYTYDGRHRLDTITEVLCAANQRPCVGGNILSTRVVDDYDYDGNDNRVLVVEDNGSGATTRHYCHDARNQVITVRSAAGCSTGLLETFAYDVAGNRTSALGRTYTFDAQGRLATCSGAPACSPTHDADGRLSRITTLATGTWSYVYDAEGRMTSACQAASCSGSGFARLDMTYDGEGHRTRLIETPASGPATTTDFRYVGETVSSEVSTTPGVSTITRIFTTDESGAIIKMTVSGDPVALHNGSYLVTWNGHGDAVSLSKIEATGALTPANRYAYSTWGTPTTSPANGYGDLRFRYLYVGQFDVQWDNSTAIPAGLLYMHARHYSPEFGRFLQPDPSGLESNLYAYAENSPVTKSDPTGLCLRCAILRAGRWVVSSRTVWSYLRSYGGAKVTGRFLGYGLVLSLTRRTSKPYVFRNYAPSQGCTAGQWFVVIVQGWGGGLFGIGGGFVAMWTGVGAVGGAIAFTWGMGSTAWAFADTVSCLTRGQPAV